MVLCHVMSCHVSYSGLAANYEDYGSSGPTDNYDDETSEPHLRFSFLRTAEVCAVAAACNATLCKLRHTFYNNLHHRALLRLGPYLMALQLNRVSLHACGS